jgi:hypothetical protein
MTTVYRDPELGAPVAPVGATAPVQDDNVVVVEGGGGTTATQPLGYNLEGVPVAATAATSQSMTCGVELVCLLVCVIIVVVIIIVVLAALNRLGGGNSGGGNGGNNGGGNGY